MLRHGGRVPVPRRTLYGEYVPTRSVRDLEIELPVLDAGELEPVSAPWHGNLNDAHVKTGKSVSGVLLDARLRRSHLENLDLTGAVWEDVAAIGCRFERVDLTAARLTGVTLERCHFIGCKLTWAHLSESSLNHVLFENCRLDAATLDEVETTGPTGFSGCVLVNTVVRDCQLNQASMVGCRLRQISFDSCDLRGADLRGNRLSEISGISSLRGVTIEPAQLADLTDAVMRDLGVVVRGPKS
jgi:uncharacterized protein YjbI with pentapeptide repeats